MKKEMLATGVVGLIIAILLIWVVTGIGDSDSSSSDSTTSNSQQSITPEEASVAAKQKAEEVEQKAATNARYLDYSPATFAASTTAINVISFDATWCYVCEAIEANILNGEIPENLTIFKADFDSEVELRKKYGVTSQTTFVQVTPEGDEITKWILYDTKAGIDEIVAQLQ